MQRHIIHKQKITLQVARREQAHELQNLVSDLMRNELPGKMEAVFAEMFPSDNIIRIDSLQLNLGNINPADFEQEFKNQFIAELRKSLSSKKENLSEANNEEKLNNAQSLLNSFIFFLEKGYLPWYRPAKKIAELEEEILKSLSASEYQYLFEWIRHHYHDNAVILQRLILQFSDVFLEKLISKIAPVQEGQWRNVYDDMEAILAICLKEKQALRTEIWKFTFHVLLHNSELQHSSSQMPGSHKSASAQADIKGALSKGEVWVFQLLKLLADHFGISTSGITALMEIKVKKKIKTATVKNAFKHLLQFLDTQGQLHPAANAKPPKANPSRKKNVVESAVDPEILKNKNSLDTERYKNKASILADEEAFYIKGSGVIILHFFLKPYFEDLKLFVNGKFANDAAQQRAVILLHYLATGEVEVAEFDLALQKILCGYPLNDTLPASIKLTKKEKAESDKLLHAVTDYWAPLKNTSIEGLRASFLQRDGKLATKEKGWLLTVEQKTMDVLLGKLPWGFSTIRLPWMQQILNVDWY